jgi:hypothetical protein
MTFRHAVTRLFLPTLLLTAMVVISSATVFAQDNQAPKAEIFGGYSFLHSGGDSPDGTYLGDIQKGWGAAGTWDFNRWLGLTIDVSGHYKDQANVYTFMAGPQVKFRTGRISPFLEALGGEVYVAPAHIDSQFTPGMMAGGGIDIEAGRHLAIRPIQADYIYTPAQDPFGRTAWGGYRLQAGLVLKLGVSQTQQQAVSAACVATATSVMAGEPVNVTLTPTNFNPKRTLSYQWTATPGGRVRGTDAGATVDTTGLAPGSYTVNGRVTDNGKHQMTANCSANFMVQEPVKRPPTLSCSANPTTVKAGEISTITCQGNSPDNRPLSYTCQSSAGRMTGTGATETLDTTGVPPGLITVNCTVSDDRNLTASSSATVSVAAPPMTPQARELNNCDFPNTRLPGRVDNTCKAKLDDVAQALRNDPNARAVIVGHATADEIQTKGNANLAAHRAYNSKLYLTQGEAQLNVDPSRIEVRTGAADSQKAENYIVPAGGNFRVEGTIPVDDSRMTAPAKPAR